MADAVETAWRADAATVRDVQPGAIAFLCVANSARSQIAEGLARSLAPPSVAIYSAGSVPTTVRPEAIQVLREVAVDATAHRSQHVDDLAGLGIDAVITLCADEVCPVFLSAACRVHWALPDPAAVEGPRRLDAFRAARDELFRRLRVLFEGWPAG